MGWGLARLSYLTPTQILSGWESWTPTCGSGAETFDFVLTFVPLKNGTLQRMYDWEYWMDWMGVGFTSCRDDTTFFIFKDKVRMVRKPKLYL